MDSLKLKRFLPLKNSPIERDKLWFANRIKAEHLFSSFDECIEYLNNIIREQPFNPDDIAPIKYSLSPNLVINIIDEAVCSMIYEIYLQIRREDSSSLGYYNFLLDELYNELVNKTSKIVVMKQEYKFYEPLLIMLEKIIYLCLPSFEEKKEEAQEKDLSRDYYRLMYMLYKEAKPYSDYNRKMENYYYELLTHEVIIN